MGELKGARCINGERASKLLAMLRGLARKRGAGVRGKRSGKRKRNEREARGEGKEKMLIVLLEVAARSGF